MEILIISGLSGGGKSQAASFLEDMGYYIVDNMPAGIILKFAEFCAGTQGRYDRLALVYDVRAGEDFGEDEGESLLYAPKPLVMRFVDKDAEVRPLRQRVVSEGSGGLYPPGLAIGTVVARRRDDSGLLAEVGENCYVEPPLHANWGCHTHFGNNVYANFNLTLVDDTDIYVGDSVMFGPNVVLATAGHPVDPELRRRVAQFNLPIHIGDNVWIGAGAVILPCVRIGNNSVIGAGSVVTKDIPPDVVAFGNPCRVHRAITEHDREYYYKDLKVDL